MKNKYGFIGLVSVLGLLGFCNEQKWYFAFFSFVIFFEYFFKQPDELFIMNMRKAAANAFWVGLATSVMATLFFTLQQNGVALEKGVLVGFGFSIISFSLCTAFFEWKEGRAISNDN